MVPKIASPWVVLVATGLSVFAVFLDTTILYVAFPSISATLSSFHSTWWVLVASGVCVTLFAMRLPRHVHQLEVEPAPTAAPVPAAD